MTTSTDCFPWWHGVYAPLAAESWTKTIISSGCVPDYTGSIPCDPKMMRAAAEAWLANNTPQVIEMLGGSLSQNVYTFARYMHSEVGSGTVEERVAVGEAGMNQAIRRAGLVGDVWDKLNYMLSPNGRYGQIHAPDAYCASIGKAARCNAAGRWAATSRDPSVMSILLANLVVSRQSGDFSNGAETQWGPDAMGNPVNSSARVEQFVRSAASDKQGRYYWVGPLPGVDPWHTFLTFKGPAANTAEGETLIQRGITALPMTVNGNPVRPDWSWLPTCEGGPSFLAGYPMTRGELVLISIVSVGALFGAISFDRWLNAGKAV